MICTTGCGFSAFFFYLSNIIHLFVLFSPRFNPWLIFNQTLSNFSKKQKKVPNGHVMLTDLRVFSDRLNIYGLNVEAILSIIKSDITGHGP